MKVNIADLVIDERIQIRDGIDRELVDQYVEVFDDLPPVDVFTVAAGYLLADGFHRREAAIKLKRTEIDAVLHEGGWEDAEAFAITANAKHGKPLTRAERNRAARRLLDLGWSSRRIEKAVGISDTTVLEIKQARDLRASLPAPVAEELTDTHLYRIATVEPEQQEALAARAAVDKWSEPETRAAAKILRDKDVVPEVKQAILSGALPPITRNESGQVAILEDTIQRTTEAALRKDAQMAVIAFNQSAAHLNTFTANEVADALDSRTWPATVAQLSVALAMVDALIARLTMKVVV